MSLQTSRNATIEVKTLSDGEDARGAFNLCTAFLKFNGIVVNWIYVDHAPLIYIGQCLQTCDLTKISGSISLSLLPRG